MSHADPSDLSDPLIDEVREIRRAIWEEDGQDLRLHAERLRQIERRYAERVVGTPTAPATEPGIG